MLKKDRRVDGRFGRELEEIIEEGYEEAFIDIENSNVLLYETVALWGECKKACRGVYGM